MALLLLLASVAWAQPIDTDAVHRLLPSGEYQFQPAEGRPEEPRFPLVRASSGERVGVLMLSEHPAPGVRTTTAHLTVRIEQWSRDDGALRALIAGADAIASHDGGWIGPSPLPPPPLPLVAASLCALAATLIGLGISRTPIRFEPRITHLLPALIQTSVLVYWSFYWPLVALQVPTLVAQVAIAYALEAALAARFDRAWTVGFAPLPVVLSINLFLWFQGLGAIAVVAIAIASKALFRRDGRHVFNPSALGLVAGGLAGLALPAFGYTPLFHSMNVPPAMAEWILLAALAPQLRLPIVLVSIAAFFGESVSGVLGRGPELMRPATLLAVLLLATDPATIPKSPGGRVLFGLTFGVGIRLTSMALVAAGQPDDLAKVLPLPLCNLLVPSFDRWGAQVPFNRWLAPEYNRRHVALWLALGASMLAADKARNFEGALHWTYGTPGVVRGADDVPECSENPAFCRAFYLVGAP